MKNVSAEKIWLGIKAAFPVTIPILFGWVFVGLTYGVLMSELGYGPLWSMLFSLLCFCGGMQIAAIPMMAAGFDPLQMLIMSYFVNFRHTFYGVALLEKPWDDRIVYNFHCYEPMIFTHQALSHLCPCRRAVFAGGVDEASGGAGAEVFLLRDDLPYIPVLGGSDGAGQRAWRHNNV